MDCCYSRASTDAGARPQHCGYRSKRFQSEVLRSTLDVSRRFVVVVLKITTYEWCMSEPSHRNSHFPCRRLGSNYRQDAYRYDLASTPYAFCSLLCYLLERLF